MRWWGPTVATLIGACGTHGASETPPSRYQDPEPAPDASVAGGASGDPAAGVHRVPSPALRPVFARTFPGTAFAIAATPDGDFVVVGMFDRAVDYGRGLSDYVGSNDAFIVKLDATGVVRWHKTFGTWSDDRFLDVTVSPNGNITALGDSTGAIDLGAGPLAAADPKALRASFIAQFDRDGALLGSARLGGARGARGYSLASMGADVLVSTDGPPAPLAQAAIASVSPLDGQLAFADVSADSGLVLVTGDASGFAASGTYNGTLRTGGVTGPLGMAESVFATRLTQTYELLWTRTWPAATLYALELGGPSRTFVGGGCGPGCVLPGVGGNSPYVMALDGSGNLAWVRGFNEAPHDNGVTTAGSVYAIAHDSLGNVLVTGTFMGVMDFGDRVQVADVQSDIFIAKLDPTGRTLWSGRFGGIGLDLGTGIAVDAHDDAFAVGWFQETVNFGDGPRSHAGGWYFAKLLP